MSDETNLQEVKQICKMLLYTEPQLTDIPFLVCHPYFSFTPAYLTLGHSPEKYELYDLRKEEDLQKIRNCYSDYIDKSENLMYLYMEIRDAYKLTFLKYSEPYLSKEDLAHYFADAWTISENPNQDVNCPIPYLVKMFKKCDKELLMKESDYEVYKNLPEELTVYRGVGVKRNPVGLSWTNDIKIAEWFAHRFDTDKDKGYVEYANIKKNEVLAYFNTRGEKEIVCKVPKKRIRIIED